MTNVHDHAGSDQHIHAMNLHKKDLASAKGLGIFLLSNSSVHSLRMKGRNYKL